MNIQLLEQYISEGLITKRKHPHYDLWIYNYSATCQWSQKWGEITMACRGLIMDSNYNIVARPFKKFFNIEENRHSFTSEFKVYEKLDGSLAILFHYNDEWIISTRGSFESEQAAGASEMLKGYDTSLLNKDCTYLLEYLAKDNRIVVEYDYEDLVLLAVIETQTGKELDIYTDFDNQIGFRKAKIYDGIKDTAKIKSLTKDDEEGFVIKFSNGERVKCKNENYVRLHKILTGVSNVSIWEYLSTGKSLNEFIDRVPDEMYDYVKEIEKGLLDKYREIVLECSNVYRELEDRKSTALYFKEQKYPNVLFTMLDKKNTSKIIWSLIKPKYQKPFAKIKDE